MTTETMQTIKTESGTMLIKPENVGSVTLALSKVKPPSPTYNRRNMSVKCPVWKPGMTTLEYCARFDEMNALVKGSRRTDNDRHPAPDYNPDIPVFEVLPDDPDWVEPEPAQKPVKRSRKPDPRHTQADAYQLALQRILDAIPADLVSIGDPWAALIEIRWIARHGLEMED